MKMRSFLMTCAGLGISAGLYSCKNQEAPKQEVQVPEVTVTQVHQTSGIVKNTYSAALEGVRNIEIRPQISGYLNNIYVDEGAYVNAGQLLFKIDDRPFQEQYRTAKAAVAVAEANVKNVKIDLDRKKELVENHIVSDLQVSQALATYEGAMAALEQARAAMSSAKINLDFCVIKAPVSGYVGRIPFRLGSLVSAASLEALTMLTDINEVFGYFSMSETDFAAYQERAAAGGKRDSVTLVLANGSVYPKRGVIDAVTGQFDKNTGSIAIRTKFQNPKKELRAGNTGRIEIERHMEGVLLVPIKSTIAVQDKIYAYVLGEGNKVKQALLEVVGKTTEDYYVKSGLSDGQTILTGGLGFVRADMVVKPKQAQ